MADQGDLISRSPWADRETDSALSLDRRLQLQWWPKNNLNFF